ncbi:MAG TPA: hypothetical protein VKE22_24325 [Haliangiales bacterium]|nr:hypothetical protein [Haliangiales bacterium]
MEPTLEELAALAMKYRALVLLRARRERGDPLRPEERAERRTAFRDLAERFPGALRELDALPAVELAARAAEVDVEIARVERGESAGTWVSVVADFHRTLRALLDDKRARPWRAPGGRLMNLLWATLEQRHRLPRAALEALMFGTPEGSPPDRRS